MLSRLHVKNKCCTNIHKIRLLSKLPQSFFHKKTPLKIPEDKTVIDIAKLHHAIPESFKKALYKLQLTTSEQWDFVALMHARGTYSRIFWKNINPFDVVRWEILTHMTMKNPLDIDNHTSHPTTAFALENLEKHEPIISYCMLKKILTYPDDHPDSKELHDCINFYNMFWSLGNWP